MAVNPTASGAPDASDPSMEEILASIRRILNEDDPAVPADNEAPEEDDVLVLDRSMMVATSPAEEAEPVPQSPAPAPQPRPPAAAKEVPTPPPPAPPPAEPAELVAPAAAAAAASALGSLARTIAAAGKPTHVWAGGPTLEDIVRSELRPLLKVWLDTNLSPMVERLVQAEIDRVAGRPGV
jgi:cell pole-organizing protein PopZ